MKACKTIAAAIAVLGLGLAMSCGPAPKVVQGAVVSYDANLKTLVVKDELPPNSDLAFSLEGLTKDDVGAEPAVGDQVRLAYLEQDGKLKVTRLMNLTRQAEVGKGGGGKH